MKDYRKIILLVDLTESYFRNFTHGISRYANVFGPWAFCKIPPLFFEKFGIEGIIDFAKDWRADGIIGQFNNNEDVGRLIDSGLFIIAADYREKFVHIPNVSGDYMLSGKMAAEYFIEKGYKNFAFYGLLDSNWSKERLMGFQNRLQKEGLINHSFTPEKMKSHEFWFYMPSPLLEWVENLEKPVAIFTCDDRRAEHIIEAARLANISIPDDIAVLGIDNDEILCNSTNPPISSILQDEENAGYQAAKLMDRMLQEKIIINEDIIVKPLHIITRQSSDVLAIDDKLIRNALVYINENIQSGINVHDLLKVIPLSRRALEKRFLQKVKNTIYGYILNQKVKKVVELLLVSNLSIDEISLMSGFENSKNLSRTFRKYFGESPLRYRKKYGFYE